MKSLNQEELSQSCFMGRMASSPDPQKQQSCCRINKPNFSSTQKHTLRVVLRKKKKISPASNARKNMCNALIQLTRKTENKIYRVNSLNFQLAFHRSGVQLKLLYESSFSWNQMKFKITFNYKGCGRMFSWETNTSTPLTSVDLRASQQTETDL